MHNHLTTICELGHRQFQKAIKHTGNASNEKCKLQEGLFLNAFEKGDRWALESKLNGKVAENIAHYEFIFLNGKFSLIFVVISYAPVS